MPAPTSQVSISVPRVLHLAKYYPPHPGGIEFFLRDLVHAQARQGLPVAALVHGDTTRHRHDGPVELFEAKAYGQLLYAPLSPAYPRQLHRALTQFKPDVLHLHLPNTSALTVLTSAAARRVPWITHWHADVLADNARALLRWAYRAYQPLEQRVLRRARAVIATSEDYLQSSIPLVPWRERAHVIPLGLDPERLTPPDPTDFRPQAWPADGLKVLVVGRLAHYKGHRVLLDALAQDPRVQVIIAGEGEMGESLQRQCELNGLTARVRFTGALEQSALNTLLHTCDVVCLPSVARTEAMGLVLIEAMAAGKPVIASDLPGSGMPGLVRKAGHGLLAAPGDAQQLASCLEKMKDESLQEQLGSAGSAAFRARFHIDPVADQITALYQSVI